MITTRTPSELDPDAVPVHISFKYPKASDWLKYEPVMLTPMYGMEGTLCYWLSVHRIFHRVCGWPGLTYSI